MIPDWIQLIATIVAPIVAVWIGALLVTKRYYTQRRWEIRLDAYSNILNALYDMTKHSSEIIEVDIYKKELTKEKENKYVKLYRQGEEELLKTITIGELILPLTILEKLRITLKTIDQSRNEDSYMGMMIAESSALHHGIKEFVAAARCDLGLKKGFQLREKLMRSD